jgi:hypothetical protein
MHSFGASPQKALSRFTVSSFTARSLPSLTSLAGLPTHQLSSLSLVDLPLSSLSTLTWVQRVDGSLEISDCPQLADASRLTDRVVSLSGALKLSNNAKLDTLRCTQLEPVFSVLFVWLIISSCSSSSLCVQFCVRCTLHRPSRFLSCRCCATQAACRD